MESTSVRPVELNEANIRLAEPGDVLKDPTIKGLSLRCFAESKVFYLYYRTRAGVERRPKLGRYGDITLTGARKAAKAILEKVAAGEDPSAERKAERGEATLGDLWKEYWKRHASKKKSGSEDERIWGKYLGPKWENTRLSHLTYSDVADFHEALSPTPIQANRILALISAMFSFAAHPLEWVEKNPCKGVKRYRENKRKRYASGEETAKIAQLLEQNWKDNPQSVAFLYLLILTGARLSEIASARWDQIQGDRLVLTEHKTDQKGQQRVIHLAAARWVLDKLPRTKGTITGIQNPTKLWQKIRVEAGCPDLHIHDLRHSFASAALAAGVPLDQIGELLGHSSTQTTKRYAHLIDEAASAAAASAAELIRARMTSGV